MKQELKNKKFRSPLEPVIVRSEHCNSHLIDDYGFDISKYGEANVIKKGQTDFYQIIQSYKDNADLKIVLTQIRQTGDTSLLNQRKSVFGDVSEMPTSYIEAFKAVKDSKEKIIKNMSELTDTDYSKFTDKSLKELSQETLAQQIYSKVMKHLSVNNSNNGGNANE